MPKISKKILAEQLREMETDELITRQEIKIKEPKIVLYALTPKGEALRALIDTIVDWSLRYETTWLPEKASEGSGKSKGLP